MSEATCFVFFSVTKRSLLRGLKWHGGGLIILLPHPAGGCDMAIISGLWINSATKERSPAPARTERGKSGGLRKGERGKGETSSSGLLQ